MEKKMETTTVFWTPGLGFRERISKRFLNSVREGTMKGGKKFLNC